MRAGISHLGSKGPLENGRPFSEWPTGLRSLDVGPNTRWGPLLCSFVFSVFSFPSGSAPPFSCRALLLISSTRLSLWSPGFTVKKLPNIRHPHNSLTHSSHTLPGNPGLSPDTAFFPGFSSFPCTLAVHCPPGPLGNLSSF